MRAPPKGSQEGYGRWLKGPREARVADLTDGSFRIHPEYPCSDNIEPCALFYRAGFKDPAKIIKLDSFNFTARRLRIGSRVRLSFECRTFAERTRAFFLKTILNKKIVTDEQDER